MEAAKRERRMKVKPGFCAAILGIVLHPSQPPICCRSLEVMDHGL
jgi:hypothetical protein